MKQNQRIIKNYKPYYLGIGVFSLIFGLAMEKPYMWIIGLAFLIYAFIGKLGKKVGNAKKE